MDFTTNLTQKNQVSVSNKLRLKAGFRLKQRVRVRAQKGKITIQPVEDILDLAGFLKPKNGFDALEAREEMEENYERV